LSDIGPAKNFAYFTGVNASGRKISERRRNVGVEMRGIAEDAGHGEEARGMDGYRYSNR
jgi:hypothetical protein